MLLAKVLLLIVIKTEPNLLVLNLKLQNTTIGLGLTLPQQVRLYVEI